MVLCGGDESDGNVFVRLPDDRSSLKTALSTETKLPARPERNEEAAVDITAAYQRNGPRVVQASRKSRWAQFILLLPVSEVLSKFYPLVRGSSLILDLDGSSSRSNESSRLMTF